MISVSAVGFGNAAVCSRNDKLNICKFEVRYLLLNSFKFSQVEVLFFRICEVYSALKPLIGFRDCKYVVRVGN
jgi:hypothetical protein